MISAYKNQLKTYFCSRATFLGLFIYALVCSLLFIYCNLINLSPELTTMLGGSIYAFSVAIPLISMNANKGELAVGVFLATLTVHFAMLLTNFVFFFILWDKIDAGMFLSALLGVFLIGSVFTSFAIFLQKTVKSKYLSAVLCFFLISASLLLNIWLSGGFITNSVLYKICTFLAVPFKFTELSLGVITLDVILYYVLLSEFFLCASLKHKWIISVMALVFIFGASYGLDVLCDRNPLSLDVTENKLYTLSDTTKEVLNEITDEVDVCCYYSKGNTYRPTAELLRQYQRNGEKVSLHFSDDFDQFDEGTISFKCKDAAASVLDCELTDFSSLTGSETSLYAEEKFTNAIKKVTSTEICTAFFLQGHSEDDPKDINEVLKGAGYKTDNISLASGRLPEDCDILFILSPKWDLMTHELEIINEFIEKGGSVFITLDAMTGPLKKLETRMEKWGVRTDNALVYEHEEEKIAFNIELSFYATGGEKSFLDSVFKSSIPVLVADNKPLFKSENESAEILMSTTPKGETKSLITGEGISGEIPIAITLKHGRGRLAVFGSSQYFIEVLFRETGMGNREVLLKTAEWLFGADNGVKINPKNIETPPLSFTLNEINTYYILIFIIPIVFLSCGIACWIRRRRNENK